MGGRGMFSRVGVAAVLVLAGLGRPAPAEAQLVEVVAQVGINLAEFSGDGIVSGVETGFSLGGKLRVGGGLYVDGGAFWTRSGGAIGSEGLKFNSVRFPVTIGTRLIQASVLDVRAFAGGVLSSISGVSDNDAMVVDDDLKSSLIAGRVGVGVDVGMFASDLAYEFGLSDVFEDTSSLPDGAKQRGWVLEAGLRFGL